MGGYISLKNRPKSATALNGNAIIPAREVASRVSIEVVWRWKR